ncbi:hypothetical protein B4U80_03186 [Leptotrombidium deliense]|uniref:Uncharacterized protein n=1 Tax=Leptotrombidium deliense TaxID=299467 RepID=A0A443SB50_9ACAR|nr:hypothetical protein B4U80_03186 [Leptotrombidium deliense]
MLNPFISDSVSSITNHVTSMKISPNHELSSMRVPSAVSQMNCQTNHQHYAGQQSAYPSQHSHHSHHNHHSAYSAAAVARDFILRRDAYSHHPLNTDVTGSASHTSSLFVPHNTNTESANPPHHSMKATYTRVQITQLHSTTKQPMGTTDT